MNIRKIIDKKGLFEKKKGRDLTAKCFWKHVRTLICLVLAAIIGALTLETYEAIAFVMIDLLTTAIAGAYSMLSLRLRKIEERIEAGRAV